MFSSHLLTYENFTHEKEICCYMHCYGCFLLGFEKRVVPSPLDSERKKTLFWFPFPGLLPLSYSPWEAVVSVGFL